jgi:predicted TIM-barrel fold metal-dependent hydrolase
MADKRLQPKKDCTHGAIDLMYFPPARRTSRQSRGESRCHEPIDPLVDLKKEGGLGYVFVTQCKRWSCDRRIYCEDAHLDDILRYTSPYPEHFIGIGGYNPLEISGSTHEAEIGIQQHGFRGIYVHPGSYGVALNDRRMYPLYAKALEWRVPVILDLRLLANEMHPVRASEMVQVAGDLAELNFVVAQSPWPGDEMLHLVENLPNIYFCFDTAALLKPVVRNFVNSPSGQSRCTWGSNGLPWQEALAEVARIEISNTPRLLRDNAIDLFGLNRLRKREATPFVESEPTPARIVAE